MVASLEDGVEYQMVRRVCHSLVGKSANSLKPKTVDHFVAVSRITPLTPADVLRCEAEAAREDEGPSHAEAAANDEAPSHSAAGNANKRARLEPNPELIRLSYDDMAVWVLEHVFGGVSGKVVTLGMLRAATGFDDAKIGRIMAKTKTIGSMRESRGAGGPSWTLN
jgi:hypothetical protein